MSARERVKRVKELDAPLVSLLCRMVTLPSYYENFLMILQQYDLTTASEWSVICERGCSRVWEGLGSRDFQKNACVDQMSRLVSFEVYFFGGWIGRGVRSPLALRLALCDSLIGLQSVVPQSPSHSPHHFINENS